MLVDEVQILVRAGNGGDGRVSFRREKFVPKGGPDGGKGGDGGDVYFGGVDDITALNRFRFEKKFAAQDGQPGGKDKKTGADGKDLVLKAPLGTVIKDLETNQVWECDRLGESFLIAKGGLGGRGNWSFRSATNRVPKKFEYGTYGQKRNLFLELRLFADVGIIGLPSAGKSSLLNSLTAASAKVAPYHFTTLEPNLGVMDGFVLADLPGLIEGASTGKGLGIKFLKHIKRTKILVHCISTESEDPLKDYQTVRKELADYDKDLLGKQEIILITKCDLIDKKKIKEIAKNLAPTKKEILFSSVYEAETLENLKKKLQGFFSSVVSNQSRGDSCRSRA